MKSCVVIRHLPGFLPVVSAVILYNPSEDDVIDDPDHYLRACAEVHQYTFMLQFPEFKQASWTSIIIETI